MYVLSKDEGGRSKPFTSYVQMQMYSKTWDCPAQVNLIDKEMAMPGEDTKYNVIIQFQFFLLTIIFYYRLRLCLLKPMVVEQGQRFTLRDGMLTLGTGVITKLNPRLTESERVSLTEGKKAREKAKEASGKK